MTSFLGSAALLFNLVLLCDAVALPLNLYSLGCAFAAISAALLIWAARRGALPVAAGGPPLARPRGTDWMWLLPPVLAGVSIAARTLVEPLIGNDNSFRWDHIAHLMLLHHSLAGYPPVRMEDFDLYAWCDGIPPLAPVLNFLIYSVAGSTEPRLISFRAVAEFLLLAYLTVRYARDLWGQDAGWPALAVLASSSLFIWGLAIEQETGLTAIALVAMVYLIERSPGAGEGGSAPALWAGIAAGIGAASREYGLYFVILGALLMLIRRQGRALGWFLVPAVCVGAPWYVRNWLKTGNPVYPAMGALFPTNAVHVEIMRDIADFWGFQTAPVPLGSLPPILLAVAGSVGVLGLAGLARKPRRCLGILAGMLLIVSLWIWSMPQTGGGWNYSMRVLLPALALGAILAGWIGTTRRAARVGWALLLALLSLDASRRAWLLPDFPLSTPWTLSFSEWRQLRAESDRHSKGNIWEVLVKVANGRFIVVDSPIPHVAITAIGGHATPLTSPRFAPALDDSLSVEEAMRRLRMAKVRFITFSVRNPVVLKFVRRHATLRRLERDYAPIADLHGLMVYDLEFLSLKHPAEPPAK